MLQWCKYHNLQKQFLVDFYYCKITPLGLELVFHSTIPGKCCFEYLRNARIKVGLDCCQYRKQVTFQGQSMQFSQVSVEGPLGR